jgi:HPt (histidine-containing phosphotransfer) domain-containing protein
MSRPAIDRETLERLLDITGGDVEFLDELVDTYLEDGRAQVAALKAAVAAGVPEDLVRPAHTLKSSSANVGALDLADACRQLETVARAGAADDAERLVGAIAVAFEAAQDGLMAARVERDGRAGPGALGRARSAGGEPGG